MDSYRVYRLLKLSEITQTKQKELPQHSAVVPSPTQSCPALLSPSQTCTAGCLACCLAGCLARLLSGWLAVWPAACCSSCCSGAEGPLGSGPRLGVWPGRPGLDLVGFAWPSLAGLCRVVYYKVLEAISLFDTVLQRMYCLDKGELWHISNDVL